MDRGVALVTEDQAHIEIKVPQGLGCLYTSTWCLDQCRIWNSSS